MSEGQNQNDVGIDSTDQVNNSASVSKVFNDNYKTLVYFANRFVKDKDAAEDIVQDIFVKYWIRQLDRDEFPELSFLYTSVRNACLNHIRNKQTQSNKLKLLGNKYDDDYALLSIIKAEAIKEIYNAVQKLPVQCRKIVHLGYFENMANHEIADVLRISINTVKTQKTRGFQLLRNKIEPDSLALIFLLHWAFNNKL